MKAFVLSREQIASTAAAIVVDEIAARYDRRVDTFTGSNWSLETPLFEGGMELSAAEADACGARLRRFFSAASPTNAEISGPTLAGATLGDWAAAIEAATSRRLTALSFVAAGDEAREHSHPSDAIFADAAAAANLLYGRRRLLSLVSPHSLMGFVLSILTPNLLKAPSVDARRLPPDELKSTLAFGDALVATPSIWRYVIAQEVVAPDNTMAISFGEPMTPELSAMIRKAGFGAQREVYGSTEHGLIGWRDSPSDPFALFDQWRRKGDELVRVSPSGDAKAVVPMDILTFEGDRRFRLGGRRDGAAQIGAVNVFPARIAAKIAEHPDVADCVVAVSKHAGGADRLIATIKLAKPGPPTERVARSIDGWCRQRLRPHERPRIYNFADAAAK